MYLNFIVLISLYKSCLISLRFKLVRRIFKRVMHAPNTKFWLTCRLVCMNFVFPFQPKFCNSLVASLLALLLAWLTKRCFPQPCIAQETDIDQYLSTSPVWRELYRSSLAKYSAVWNKVSQSTVTSDIAQETDIDQYLSTSPVSRDLHRSSLAKCLAVWNSQSINCHIWHCSGDRYWPISINITSFKRPLQKFTCQVFSCVE